MNTTPTDPVCEFGSLFGDNITDNKLYLILDTFQDNYGPYHGYICTALCAYGIIANVVNIVVLTQPTMRTAVNVLLATIALCDMGTMATYLVYVLHVQVLGTSSRCHSQIYSRNWLLYILFHQHWSILLHTTSLWLAVLLALLRLIVIRRCRWAGQLLRAPSIAKAIVCICITLTLCMVPIGMLNTIDSFGPDTTCVANENATTYNVVLSKTAMEHNCLLLRVVLWISGLLFKLVPCILLTFLISGLLHSYHKAQMRNVRILRKTTARRHVQMLAENRRESSVLHERMRAGPSTSANGAPHHATFTSRTTTMLTLILMIFLITETPQAIVAVLGGLYPNDIYHAIYPRLGDLFDLLSLINSSINFVLYCLMSSKFRVTFREIFCARARRQEAVRRRRRQMIAEGMGWSVQLSILATPRFKRYALWRTRTS